MEWCLLLLGGAGRGGEGVGGDLPTLANPVEKALHRCVSWLAFQVILDVCQVNNHC